MSKPHRIHRSGKKGWQAPTNSVYAGRPTIWGDPFTTGPLTERITEYKSYITLLADKRLATSDLQSLRGKGLTCWCPPNPPCHADILLELANGDPSP